jgi:outer membrane receptor protein involved in Fe transport
MNVRTLFALFFALIFSAAVSKAAPAPETTGSISGTLLDNQSKSPLDNVSIFIYQGNKTTPVKVANTDEKGVFVFSELLPGEYRIEASYLGYLPFEEAVQVLANQKIQKNIDLTLDAKSLKAVEVKGLRSNMKLSVDKKVFAVDQSVAAAGASTSDILKNIPSVEVDAEGSISLRNSSNVIIWINGKPSGLTAENRSQVLEQMPAESIDRIEVITNPSAKFSAEGSAGIINIILKKDRKAGYYGSLRAGVSQPWGTNLGANINYNSPKWDLYGNIGLRKNTNDGSGSTQRENFFTTPHFMDSQTNRDFSSNGLFLRGGADYHINDKHTVGLSGFLMNGDNDMNSTIGYTYSDATRQLMETRTRTTDGGGSHRNAEVSLDYQWEIGQEHTFQATVTLGGGSFPNESTYRQLQKDALGNVLSTNYQKSSSTGDHRDLEVEIDYVRKLSDAWKVEAGWKSDVTNSTSDDRIYNGENATAPFSYNYFDYQEAIHAAYGTLTGKITPLLGFQLGLRAEKSNIDFTSTNKITNVAFPKNKSYLELFPTLFLNYTLSEGNDLQMNYSRRINRPRGRALNPFVNISDSTNIWIGNPDLDPEMSHSLEVNYLKTWQSHTLSGAIYHRLSDKVIQSISYLDNGVMYQKPENVAHSTSSGMEIVAKDQLFKILETTSTLNLYHQQLDAFTYRGIAYPGNKGFSWNFRLNGQLMLPQNIMAQISGFYSSPRVVAQGETKAAYSLDMGLRKSLWDRKLQIALNAQNLLNSFKFESSTTGPGFSQHSSNQFFSRSLRLNVTWNFGNLKPKKQQRGEGKEEREPGNEGQSMDMGF